MFNISFFRRTSDTFGLDIGSSAVKVVQLHGSSLIGLGVASLPPDAIAEGTIKDPPSVVEAIKDAVGRAAVGSKEAAIGVSGRELIIKKVQIPEWRARSCETRCSSKPNNTIRSPSTRSSLTNNSW